MTVPAPAPAPVEPAPTCAACPHPWAEHDPIGVRFCTVTTSRGLDRGCVCARP